VDVLVKHSWVLIAALIAIAMAPEVDRVEPGLGGWKYVAGAMFAVLLYLSVLLHEMSHALMAKRFGLPVRSITLHFLGGVTEIEGEADTPSREFAISVVGPITSIGVGLVSLALLQVTPDGLLTLAVGALAFANLVVGALNLIPGLPLDGGRVLRAGVWRLTGDPFRATIVAGWAGRGVAILAFVYPWIRTRITGEEVLYQDFIISFVIALFLWTGASASIMSARVRARLPKLHARDLARRSLVVPPDLPLAEAVRRARDEQAGAIVTISSSGTPLGVVSETALLATPEDRRPWMPTEAVARQVEPGLILAADIEGEPLIRAMQATPATEYLLIERDGSVYGVLSTEDVDRAFSAAK
jgi:Zn-dependent protease